MLQGEKKTIIWDEHEPPKDYIWVHDGKAEEYDFQAKEWKVSKYDVAGLRYGHSNKRTMIFESNSVPPKNYIWNKDGDVLVQEDNKSWNDINGEKISSWLIVDHTNFTEAVQNQLVDYYTNYPTEARQDGEEWPPFTASAFPWFVVNYKFDGNSELRVYRNNELIFSDWKPSAKITTEDNNVVDRTYAILSVPEDLNLRDYTETNEGNELKMNPSEFKVYIVKE